jgi:UDP-N-acetylmuramyl pentapeptide phosphotransferase/UDP-N-acetylglucosamine-1-phosphate transferase
VIAGLLALLALVFLAANGLTRLLCSPASRLYHLDHPNERSLHAEPLPRTGGLAIFGSVLLGIIVTVALGDGAIFQANGILWILSMALLVGAVSFWDDRTDLSPGLRLGVQALAAGGVTWGAGLTVTTIPVPLLGSLALGWLAVPVTMLFLMWMANLYNFMDGMDGFAGGMTVIGCGLLGYFGWQAHHPVIAVIATLQSAAAAGFLIHNFPPAKIFMGDVGSVSIGFLAAALIVLGCRDGVFDLWVPLIVYSPFILDATVTLVRRALRHEKVWEAHRDHYYQRLVLSGWGHRRTVLAEYGVMALCGGFALLYQYAADEWQLVVLGAWGMTFLSLALAVRGVERRMIQPFGS